MMLHLTEEIESYVSRIDALRAERSAPDASAQLFDALYEEVSQGIEELRIADEELRARDREIYNAYAAVVQERRRYQNLFENAPSALILTDSRGVLIDVNRRAAQLFEFSPEHLRGKPLSSFVENRQRQQFRRWFSGLSLGRDENPELAIELRAHRRGAFGAELQVTRIEGEYPSAVQLLWTISDRSQNDRAERDAELAAIVCAAGDALLTQSLDGRILTANAACRTLYGAAIEGAIGQSVERLIAPECRREHERVIDGLTPALPVRCLDLLHLRGEGVRINVSVTYSLITSSDAPPRVALAVREITDRKRLEAHLHERALEHERSSHRKTDFIAILAHELQNPLNVIMAALESLDLGGERSQRADSAEICLRNARYMARLIHELLDLSRIDRDELAIAPARVQVREIVRRAVELACPVLDSCRQTLEIDQPKESIVIEADAVRIAQALTNLLDNAAKYSNPGSTIRVSVAVTDDRVNFHVSDRGVGIDAALIGRVFEPFVQGESERRRARAGLGLGLALVKRIVDLHGGSVAAESEGPGRGARFTIALPRVAKSRSDSR